MRNFIKYFLATFLFTLTLSSCATDCEIAVAEPISTTRIIVEPYNYYHFYPHYHYYYYYPRYRYTRPTPPRPRPHKPFPTQPRPQGNINHNRPMTTPPQPRTNMNRGNTFQRNRR